MSSNEVLEVLRPEVVEHPDQLPGPALVELWLRNHPAQTAKTYRSAVKDFERHACPLHEILRSRKFANSAAAAYRMNLLERDPMLAPSTINVRLAALRSFVEFAQDKTDIEWDLRVKGVKSATYKDTRGPGLEGFQKILDAADGERRELAMVRLMYSLGLRRNEVVTLDVEHVDFEAGRVAVLRKGYLERLLISMTPKVVDALAAWLKERGEQPGPLFTSYDIHGNPTGERLTADGLSQVMDRLGKKSGTRARCHGLRHLAITQVIKRNGGDLVAAQAFSGHKDVNVLRKYDDNQEDRAGKMAVMIDEDV